MSGCFLWMPSPEKFRATEGAVEVESHHEHILGEWCPILERAGPCSNARHLFLAAGL